MKAISSNRQPTFKALAGTVFLKSVKDRMALLLQVRSGSAGSAHPALLTGAEAIKQIIASLEGPGEPGKALNLEELQLLETFSWLLTKEQEAKHGALVKAAFAHPPPATGSRKSLAAANVTDSSGAAAASRKKKVAEDLAATTLSLFKKKPKTN